MEISTRVRRNNREYKKLRAYDAFAVAAIALIAVCMVFSLWFFTVKTEDGGMSPSINEGELILFDRAAKYVSSPERGDIVAIRDGERMLITRIVGMAGERVEIKHGLVYINGYLLDESDYSVGETLLDMEETTVPRGSYFVLPDERHRADVASAESLIIRGGDISGMARARIAPMARVCLFS